MLKDRSSSVVSQMKFPENAIPNLKKICLLIFQTDKFNKIFNKIKLKCIEPGDKPEMLI